MNKKYFIGIDSGTSGIKAVLFDENGTELMKQGYPLTPICKTESWFEEDASEIWDKAQKCIRAITEQYPQNQIAGVGITAQGDGLWLMGKDGEPVRNGCCFCDGRGAEQFERWTEDGTAQRVFELTGTRIFTGNQPCIVKWMEENEPESLVRAKYLMHLKDFLFFKLTGSITTDTTDQSLVFIDVKNGSYDTRLFDLYGLTKYMEKYPVLKTSVENSACISHDIAKQLGLQEKTLVTSGPMDVAACAVGAGVVEKGCCCSIIGTAALHEMVIDEPCRDTIFAGMTVCHAVDHKWLRLMASLAGTPNLEWVLGILGDNITKPAAEKGLSIYDYAEQLVEQTPIGANGVLYHPYLLAGGERAPFTDPTARASFTGISVRHTPADLLRACYEGVAYAMLDCYEHMPVEIKRVTVCGGGASSAVWCQMFADILGKQVVVVEGNELGAKGAIINNAVAQGVFQSFEQAVQKTVKVKKLYDCNEDRHKEYIKFYPLFKRTYEVLGETWRMRHNILFS